MYQKLEEYSNKYMSVYQGKGRIIFDFKHPRLYHRNGTGFEGLSGGEANSVNFYDDVTADYRYASGTASGVTTGISGLGNNAGSISNISIQSISMANQDVVEMKTLVLSSKTVFGKIYVLDSIGTPVNMKHIGKNLRQGAVAHSAIKLFGQYNSKVYELVAAALLSKENITFDNLKPLIMGLGKPSNHMLNDNFKELTAIILSFCYPVLREIKYCEWSYCGIGGSADLSSPSGPKGASWHEHMDRSKNLIQTLRKATGIEGIAFIKHLLFLSQGKKEYRAVVRHCIGKGPTDHDNERFVLDQLSAGVDPKLLLDTRGFTVDTNIQIPIFSETVPATDPYKDARIVPTPYKVVEFYHFGVFKMLEIFQDLIPIDYWFELQSIPVCIYLATPRQKDIIKDWLKKQSDSTKKKVFLNFRVDLLVDTITQLAEYTDTTKLPPKALEFFPNGLQMPKRWKTVKELHDIVSMDYNKIKSLASWKSITYTEELLKLGNIDFGDGLTSELPQDTPRVVEYGQVLKHCVASYADRCARNNDTVILSINKNGRFLYTLELRQYHGAGFDGDNKPIAKYTIQQFKGLSNKVPTYEEVESILKKLLDTGLIEYITEPRQAMPISGLNASISMDRSLITGMGGTVTNYTAPLNGIAPLIVGVIHTNQSDSIENRDLSDLVERNQAAFGEDLNVNELIRALEAGSMNINNTTVRDDDGVLNAARQR